MDKIKKLQGNIASIQVGFEPVFWVHSDPEVLLSFAEKKVKCKDRDADKYQRTIHYSSRDKIEGVDPQPLIGNYRLESREQALTLIGTHDLIVQEIFILDDGRESCGNIADIFTIKETTEQISTKPITELGGGIYASSPVAHFKVKKIKCKQ
jgi:hypothetical protein